MVRLLVDNTGLNADDIGGIQFMGQRMNVKYHQISHPGSCPSLGRYWRDQ